LADLAADGGHHVQEIRIIIHVPGSEEFKDTQDAAGTLHRKSHRADEPCFHGQFAAASDFPSRKRGKIR
jgi:hypothetical protein